MSRSLYSIIGFEDSHSITTTKPTNEGTVYENEGNISDIRQSDEKVALLNFWTIQTPEILFCLSSVQILTALSKKLMWIERRACIIADNPKRSPPEGARDL